MNNLTGRGHLFRDRGLDRGHPETGNAVNAEARVVGATVTGPERADGVAAPPAGVV